MKDGSDVSASLAGAAALLHAFYSPYLPTTTSNNNNNNNKKTFLRQQETNNIVEEHFPAGSSEDEQMLDLAALEIDEIKEHLWYQCRVAVQGLNLCPAKAESN